MRISTVTPVIIQICMYDLIFHSSDTDESENLDRYALSRLSMVEVAHLGTDGATGAVVV